MLTIFCEKLGTITFSLLISLILSGCVNNLSYEEPSSGPRARARFVTNDDNNVTIIKQFDNSECDKGKEMMRLIKGKSLRGPVKSLEMPLWKFNNNNASAKEVYMESNKNYNLMFFSIRNFRLYPYRIFQPCGVLVNKIFKKDRDYELVFKRSPAMGLKECWVEITEIKKWKF